ncbi:hypothetical protein AAHB37_18760 [Glutamicibacter halophytocola]
MINPFDESTLDSVEALLAGTDQLLEQSYPGDSGARQPIHTVYVPGDKYTPDLPAAWGRNAIASCRRPHGPVRPGGQAEPGRAAAPGRAGGRQAGQRTHRRLAHRL